MLSLEMKYESVRVSTSTKLQLAKNNELKREGKVQGEVRASSFEIN